MKLFDKVYVKSKKTMGFIVDIVENSYTVEREGNAGPIFWNLPEELRVVLDRFDQVIGRS